jgi:hypothetical protein
MTVIVASVPMRMMAADSGLFFESYDGSGDYTHVQQCAKIETIKGSLVATCGGAADGEQFYAWLRRGRRGRKPKLRYPKEFSALVLTSDGKLLMWDQACDAPMLFSEPYAAIGGAAAAALGALDAMNECGHDIDPRLAVEIAIRRSPLAKGPIQFLALPRHDQPDPAVPPSSPVCA